MLSSSLIPDANKIVFSQIFDNIAALDVDIKVRLRKGTHLEKFNNLGGGGLVLGAGVVRDGHLELTGGHHEELVVSWT